MQIWIFSIITAVFSVTWSCWFAAQEIFHIIIIIMSISVETVINIFQDTLSRK